MTQTIIVIGILAVTVFFTVRWAVRQATGKGSGCNCGCQGCPYSRGKECHCSKEMKLPEIDTGK